MRVLAVGGRESMSYLTDLRLVRRLGGLGLADLGTETGFGPALEGSTHRANGPTSLLRSS